MKKTIALAFIVLGGCSCLAQNNESRHVGKHIHRIYINEIHFPNNPDWDGLVRSKLISSLVQDCGSDCAVVEDIGPNGDNGEDAADAVLTGNVFVQSPDGHRFHVQGAMRLIDKDGTVVWAATTYSSPFARSASSSFAENTAKKLAAFIAQSGK